MTFLQGVGSLRCRIVHHTGTMIRFTTGQLGQLPLSDLDCVLELPDGAVVEGHFRRHPQNPYIGGPALVRWIKAWVPRNAPVDALVNQVGTRNRLRLQIAGLPHVHVDPVIEKRVIRRARHLRTEAQTERRRRLYAAWERDPNLRAVALDAWGADCQVTGCTYLASVPAHLRGRMVDVHHLNHVSKGGTDSPLNICVICVVHHQLIHRAPMTRLQSWNLDGSIVLVNGLTLTIVRDARLIL